MKVQYLSADVCGVLVKAEMSGKDIVNIEADFRGRTTASIQKYHRPFIKNSSYKLEIYNKDLGLICSDFFASKQACVNQFWEDLRHVARNTPPADLFEEKPTRADHELNNHEHDKCYW
jgi:hypothetical protein